LRLVFAEMASRERSLCGVDSHDDEPGVPLAAVPILQRAARRFRPVGAAAAAGVVEVRVRVSNLCDFGVAHQGSQWRSVGSPRPRSTSPE
jgi:hypothetical protein